MNPKQKRMRSIARGFLLVTLTACGVGSVNAESTILVKTDFNHATLGSYSNNATINVSQAVTEQMVVFVSGPTNVIAAVDLSAGNTALDFTDNASGGNCYVRRVFPALNTGLEGVNYVEGHFEVTALGTAGTSNNPELQFLLSQSFDSAGTYSAVQMQFRGRGAFTYRDGASSINGPTMETGVVYRVDFHVDLSDGVQDTWGFTLTRLNDSTVVTTQKRLGTRGANLSPDRVVLNAGSNPGAMSATAFARIDNIDITASMKPIPPAPTVLVIR